MPHERWLLEKCSYHVFQPTVGKCATMQVVKQPEHGRALKTEKQKCPFFQTNHHFANHSKIQGKSPWLIANHSKIQGTFHPFRFVNPRHCGSGNVFSLSVDSARPRDQRIMWRYE